MWLPNSGSPKCITSSLIPNFVKFKSAVALWSLAQVKTSLKNARVKMSHERIVGASEIHDLVL